MNPSTFHQLLCRSPGPETEINQLFAGKQKVIYSRDHGQRTEMACQPIQGVVQLIVELVIINCKKRKEVLY
jgi:hypothetical protein